MQELLALSDEDRQTAMDRFRLLQLHLEQNRTEQIAPFGCCGGRAAGFMDTILPPITRAPAVSAFSEITLNSSRHKEVCVIPRVEAPPLLDGILPTWKTKDSHPFIKALEQERGTYSE